MVLKRHYPNFNQLLESIPDHRQRSSYQVAELLMAGLSMFIFKRGSRNNTDCGASGNYEANYITVFGMRLPVMDTVDVFLRGLEPDNLETLKATLVSKLIEKKVLSKWKYNGHYIVAVDGTGIYSFDYEPFEGCPYKESKNGKKSWQVYVLEAKLLCGNGLSISLATQWLDNKENISDKQDCELTAFARLAQKIKQQWPRLPIILTADALYVNAPVFDICSNNGWPFIITFKEGTLKTVWKTIGLLYDLQVADNKQEKIISKDSKGWKYETGMYINELKYQHHTLNWIEYTSGYKGEPPIDRFVHITNMTITKDNIWQMSNHGRLRWCIENEGFNTQKNNGYKLQHKYSRTSPTAMKNYYQLLQIAHLINQLTEKLLRVKDQIKAGKLTWKAIWEDIMADMKKQVINISELQTALEIQKQLRY